MPRGSLFVPMLHRLTTVERPMFFVADDEGRIPVPKGDKNSLKTLRVTLARMKKKGFVGRRKSRSLNCPAYALTPSGKMMKQEMISGKSHR